MHKPEGVSSWRFIAAACVAALPLSCSKPDPPPPDRAETLRIAVRADPGVLDPVTEHGTLARLISVLIAEPLVDLDSRLRPVPRLAIEWRREQKTNAWWFRLRPGILWQDGSPLTVADVEATLERALDPRTPSLDLKALFGKVRSIESPAAQEIRVSFEGTAPLTPMPWQRLAILPAGGKALAQRQEPWLSGSGPYRLARWRRNEWILLERNPSWWGGEPGIRYLLFDIIPDELAAARALERNDVDIATVRASTVERARAGETPFRLIEYDRPVVYVVVWNLRESSEIFGDARLRRALTLALDRPGFATRVRRGQARVAATLYPPLWRLGRGGVEPLAFNPAGAKRLLEEAGWSDTDADGWRERDGRRLSFPLLYAMEDPIRRDAAQLLQADLARVGVEIRLERVDAFSLVRRLRSHQFVAAVHAWRLDPEPRTYDFLHSSQAASGLNYGGYSDPDLDRLLEREITEIELSARRAAGQAIEEYLREQAPLLFICFPVQFVGVSQRVEGFDIGPLGLLQGFPGPARWRLRQEDER